MSGENSTLGAPKYAKEVTLSTGVKVGIIESKGHHIAKAQGLMDGDPTKYLAAYISVCCYVDGKTQPMEHYLDEMSGKDFTTLMVAFQDINF